MPSLLDPLFVGSIVFAAVAAACALAVLARDFRRPAHRAFALLAGCLGMLSLVSAAASGAFGGPRDGHWFRMLPYFGLALPFLVVGFALVFPRPRAEPARLRPWWALLAGACVCCLAAYLLDHALAGQGPLAALPALGYVFFVALPALLAWDAARATSRATASAAAAAACGLAAAPLYALPTALTLLFGSRPLASLLVVLLAALVAATVGLLLVPASAAGARLARGVALLAPFAAGVLVFAVAVADPRAPLLPGVALAASVLCAAAGPVGIACALLGPLRAAPPARVPVLEPLPQA